jgi:pimeloyl-ACP methyl ester carboxylesterase
MRSELTEDESDYIKTHSSFVQVDEHRLRVFHAPHLLVTKLPKPTPLIVFIHGLGGQINQFEPLLQYFGLVADVLTLDLPGCGQSPLTDRRWGSYTTESLANLVFRVIKGKVDGRKVVLIGHSLGTMIAGKVALSLGEQCLAVVLLCPKVEISEKERKAIRLLTNLPEFVFDLLRKRDRAYAPEFYAYNRGGIYSASVNRMVGPNVPESVRTQQLVWNLQSQTPTTLRMLRGATPLAREEWATVIPPVQIIAGELVYLVCNSLIKGSSVSTYGG